MDLRVYYQKIRDWEKKIGAEFTVVKSRETADGGKAGTLTEVPQHIAAKLLVDGVADLAQPEELEKFRAEQMKAVREAAERAATVAAMQLTVVPKQELDALRAAKKSREKE
jgi:hypothetical protein